MISGIVNESNHQPFIECLAMIVQYKLDDLDEEAIRAEFEQKGQTSYLFTGRRATIDFTIVQEDGAGVHQVDIKCPGFLDNEIKLAIQICQHYALAPSQ